MRFLKDVSRAISAAFRLLAGPNPQVMQVRGRLQPIVIPEENPVTKQRYALQIRRAANQAARARAEEAVDAEECDGFARTRIQLF